MAVKPCVVRIVGEYFWVTVAGQMHIRLASFEEARLECWFWLRLLADIEGAKKLAPRRAESL